MAHSYY